MISISVSRHIFLKTLWYLLESVSNFLINEASEHFTFVHVLKHVQITKLNMFLQQIEGHELCTNHMLVDEEGEQDMAGRRKEQLNLSGPFVGGHLLLFSYADTQSHPFRWESSHVFINSVFSCFLSLCLSLNCSGADAFLGNIVVYNMPWEP